jgi:hypothetical protein
LAFVTISLAEGLSGKERRRGARLGPRSVVSTRSAADLLVAAGFEEVESVDVTDQFAVTAKEWQREYMTHEAELRPLLGAEFDERCGDRRDLIDGIEEGLLERYLASGTKPS